MSKIIQTDDRGRASLGADLADRLFIRRDLAGGGIALDPAEVTAIKPVLPERLDWAAHDGHPGIYLGQIDQDGDLEDHYWDPDTDDPHIRIIGRAGAGSTSVADVIVTYALTHGGNVVILDPKGIDFVWAADHPGAEHLSSPSPDDVLDAVTRVRAEVDRRINITGEHVRKGEPRPVHTPLFIVLDIVEHLLNDAKRDLPGKQFSQLLTMTEFIAKIGREANVHLVLTGNPTTDPTLRKLTSLCEVVTLGDLDPLLSGMLSLSRRGYRSGGVRGRGLATRNREDQYFEFQAAYLPREEAVLLCDAANSGNEGQKQ